MDGEHHAASIHSSEGDSWSLPHSYHHLYRVGNGLVAQPNELSLTAEEGGIEAAKSVTEKVSKIKYGVGRDKLLLCSSVNHSSPSQGRTRHVFRAGQSSSTVNPRSVVRRLDGLHQH